ncbi:MAG: sigma-70 family RNA polymerase sigma factor [Moorea sp. SIO2B7]|nr:sigma-70 family RNA polymerase sigma factor [Moorena sp. SIO2B7]
MDCALTEQGNSELTSVFWQQWTQYQDQLYRCCLKFMNSNPTDAEDALSQAMLKAWEKVQIYAGKIDNLKAWLFKLTSNLCIDIIRQRSRGAVGVESIEWVGDSEEIGIGSTVASPESCLEREEKSTEIRQAIANLPETLRDTFILHFYQELTHTEIAQRQGISYDNVCRRISRARKQLKEKLSGYFLGIDGDDQQQEPVYEVNAGQEGTAEDKKNTGAIACREDSAQEIGQGASVHLNLQKKTDEENQQKTEPVQEASVFSEVSVVDTSVAGKIASIEESAQEKNSQEAIASGGGSTVEKQRIGALAQNEGSVVAVCDRGSIRENQEIIHPNFWTSLTSPAPLSIVPRVRVNKKHVEDARSCGEKVGRVYAPKILSGSWLRAIASSLVLLRDTFIFHCLSTAQRYCNSPT